ncbi:MAG TPA: cytochrome b N-terminal domain-containing protein [Puia sp.]|uniref:cytochrome b N-terminal domain-containing protein n=1 Tax=Puia sp. TaxID=2045100 RepID=UPI002D097B87|nr:cytochrome b N-terminal domain-containing protein [Puia sp.]HVU94267.1 cytochrome b N-terminal domain-containing protein [Puia sp.]
MHTIRKILRWLEDRTGLGELAMRVAKHPVPPGSKWAYVFGSATLFCLILQVITGVALALMYQPSSSTAYQSLQFITERARFGRVLRGIHYFGASGMIVMVGIHMIRVYITAAYKYPREVTWISGVFLFILTIAMGFTGQLLRWDSNGVWSSVVAAEQLGRIPLIGRPAARLLLGGDTIGGHSLSRFFSYHVFIVPAFIFLLVGLHVYFVLHHGISEPPKAGRPVVRDKYRQWYKEMLKEKGVPFWPYAAWRDLLFGALTICVILGLAVLFGPPGLTEPPDPSLVHTTPKPDWYMLAIFALFALMPPRIESYMIVLGPLATVIFLLCMPFFSNKGERSPLRRPWAVFGTICVVVFVFGLFLTGMHSPWSPKFKAMPLPASTIRSSDSVVVRGASLFYRKACLYCHKIEGQGGDTGPDLSAVARRLTADELKLRLVNGGRNMPAYGGLMTNDELKALVEFLQTRK